MLEKRRAKRRDAELARQQRTADLAEEFSQVSINGDDEDEDDHRGRSRTRGGYSDDEIEEDEEPVHHDQDSGEDEDPNKEEDMEDFPGNFYNSDNLDEDNPVQDEDGELPSGDEEEDDARSGARSELVLLSVFSFTFS